MNYKLDFYTSHHQFYICDKESPRETDKDDFWTEEALQSRLAIGHGILGVSVECYGPVKAELIELQIKNNYIANDQYDHIVEGGLDIWSGVLQILDCPSSQVELELKVLPGKYRVRIYSSNLASVDGDSGDDTYKIEIWPETNTSRIVLKQFIDKE